MPRCFGQQHGSDFLRSGVAVAPSERNYDPNHYLCFEDIWIDDPKSPAWIQVMIKASKTDPFRQGVTLHLGCIGADLCPMVAVVEYIVVRGSKAGPPFVWQDGKYLTRVSFVKEVRAALTVAGFNAADFTGHSFRIDVATTASTCGIQDSLIKTLGRWESSAYTSYIRTTLEVLQGVSQSLISWCTAGIRLITDGAFSGMDAIPRLYWQNIIDVGIQWWW